ncbi:transcription factor grauzone-like [Toxorhynchites rutilus septentrionalis]|uniref:transcription factor grauzone-like n=1 Tax=Toxorhynchites rutilus septentrionalis TaxID=329112 RepID=UPI0024789090|nr:transcription factor grauzone-like [Toxorhynchites rutilus septentrionalis]
MSQIVMDSKDCFTCFRNSENYLFILDTTQGIAELLVQHFWFQPEDFNEEQILCHSCWNQLDSFHRFFADVQQNHLRKSSVSDIKQEFIDVELPPQEPEITLEIKQEYSDNDEDGSSGEEFNPKPAEDSLTSESDTGSGQAAIKPKRKYVRREKLEESDAKQERIYHAKTAEQLAEEDAIIQTHVKYICDNCGINCPTFATFQKHVQDEHGTKGFIVCCGQRYHKKVHLLEHVQKLEDPDKFKCDICHKSFVNSHGVQRHKQEIHLPDELKIYHCDRCPKKFAKETQLAFHLKGHVNLDNATAKCELCEKIFPTEPLLKTHVKIRHTRPTDFICDVCAKGFYSKAEFLRHKKEHELSPAELRVQCDVCLQWLKNRVSWRKHYRRHNQGPAACNLCDHISPNRTALAGHKRHRHSDTAISHVCKECGKEFKRAISLKEHMASHTGEALYSCTFCSRTFNSNANMFSHRKKMHPQEWLEQKNAQKAAQQGVPRNGQ